MDTKSKVFLWVLCILLVLSVSATFYKTVILEDVEYYESEEEGSGDTEEAEEETGDTEDLGEESLDLSDSEEVTEITE